MEMGGIVRWVVFMEMGAWDREMGCFFMEMGGMWEMGGFYGDGWFLWSWMDFIEIGGL
jgi:hypothetical protein